jgi:phage-related tail protein
METKLVALEREVVAVANDERRTREWVGTVDKKLDEYSKDVRSRFERIGEQIADLRVKVAVYGAGGGVVGAFVGDMIFKILAK